MRLAIHCRHIHICIHTFSFLFSYTHTSLQDIRTTRTFLDNYHQDRSHEEILELQAATTYVEKLSEASDVLFSDIRAKHDGFTLEEVPQSVVPCGALTYAYMVGKFRLRWMFYRITAFFCGIPHHRSVNEVVNSGKNHKPEGVAIRHNIDPVLFRKVAGRVGWVFPLLP